MKTKITTSNSIHPNIERLFCLNKEKDKITHRIISELEMLNNEIDIEAINESKIIDDLNTIKSINKRLRKSIDSLNNLKRIKKEIKHLNTGRLLT